jgi:hypothetical protein
MKAISIKVNTAISLNRQERQDLQANDDYDDRQDCL